MLSFRGRILRSTWWWQTAAASIIFVVLFVFLESTFGRVTTWVLYPPYLWVVASLCTRRLHDRGQSPLWFLVAAIPVLGPLWLFVTLALRAGTPGENQYGPDPREHDADYLVVR